MIPFVMQRKFYTLASKFIQRNCKEDMVMSWVEGREEADFRCKITRDYMYIIS